MAKFRGKYIFTRGASNAGIVSIEGNYLLEDFTSIRDIQNDDLIYDGDTLLAARLYNPSTNFTSLVLATSTLTNSELLEIILVADNTPGSADFGTKINDATIPTGGVGNLGWLSAIWKLNSDRLPTLSNNRIPVESQVATRTYINFPTTTFSSSGDNTVIAGAVGDRYISDFTIQNGSTTDIVVLVKLGATTIIPVPCPSKSDGIIREFTFDKELLLPSNTAFIVNLSSAVTVYVSGRFRTA